MAFVPADAPSELRRIFLGLGPEDGRRAKATQLLQRASQGDAASCMPLVFERIVTFPSAQGLGLHVLSEMLRLHPAVLAQELTSSRVYDLFHPKADDGPPAAFLHRFLSWKQSQRMNVSEESGKLQKLLLRRAKLQDVRKLPSSAARSWLVRIWLDVPGSRPEMQLLTGCCARWVSDPSTSLKEKLPCVALMQPEYERRRHPEGDTWLLSMLLEQVCRDPQNHSADLQHLLWLMGSAPTPSLVKPLLDNLAQERGRLVTLWVCLCLWAPQPQPQDPSLPPWPQGQPPPSHALLLAMLSAFAQLPASDDLCRTSLLSLGAIAVSGQGPVALGAADLLLLLHRDGPKLRGEVWTPLMPIVEGQLAGRSRSAAELLSRMKSVPPGSSGAPQVLGGRMPDQAFATAPAFGKPSAFGKPPATAPGGLPGNRPQAFQSAPLPQSAQFLSNGRPDDLVVQYEPTRVGLQNTNNTCYMNSFIQSLFHTNRFLWRIYEFELRLKKNPSKVDREDYEFGLKLVELLREQFAKMLLTRHKHTDIWHLLQAFPANYKCGEQQDVTETIGFVFDKLGGVEQPLIREVFAGELTEKTQCQKCGSVKSRPETFSDLILKVPTEAEVKQMGAVPAIQMLLDERLKFEVLEDELWCDTCQAKHKAGKWMEITSPPAHLCAVLNRFTFNMEKMDFNKEKTPVRIDGTLHIGPFTYELYFVIVHTGKDATSGHYYAIGRRSEAPESRVDTNDWFTMDDSQIKPADMSILNGMQSEKNSDDNPYVLFYHCTQAPPTPVPHVPKAISKEVKKEDEKREE